MSPGFQTPVPVLLSLSTPLRAGQRGVPRPARFAGSTRGRLKAPSSPRLRSCGIPCPAPFPRRAGSLRRRFSRARGVARTRVGPRVRGGRGAARAAAPCLTHGGAGTRFAASGWSRRRRRRPGPLRPPARLPPASPSASVRASLASPRPPHQPRRCRPPALAPAPAPAR